MLFATLGWKLYLQFNGLKQSSAPPKIQGKLFSAIPLGDFQLLNQHGDLIGNEVLYNHWTLLSYGYLRCPDICPTTLMVKRSVQTLLAEQNQALDLMFLSIDPVHDRPEQLKQYLNYFGENITGLTPSPQDDRYQNLLEDLAISANTIKDNRFLTASELKLRDESEQAPVSHGIYLFLINPDGELQAVLYPKVVPTMAIPQFNAAQISNDIIIAISYFNHQQQAEADMLSRLP
ncbi:SCO family protein [Thalassotalea mangrovi]|nr:SCO family protein [Thalassotalea mangrovi]